MLRIGAHVSISDGPEAAVDRVEELGGNCGQIFAGSPRGWAVRDVPDEEAGAFARAESERDVGPWIVHGTYLINFATPKDDLADKSVGCVQSELDACAALGIPYHTFHPGAHTGAGEETGLENIARRLSRLDVPDGVKLLLENTAGKGTTLGKRPEDLARMVEDSELTWDDVGVCLDSCHLYAAGYDYTTPSGMDDLVDEIDASVGVGNVAYLHLNDSKHPLGSEKDEHQHIGEGEIGDAGFEQLVNHDALRDKPMVLETPVDDKGYDWNVAKIKQLREPG